MSAEPREPSEPWYVSAFGADYRSVYPHRDLESARREVAGLVARGFRGRVLDLCCGFGRHSLALLDSGVDVFGIDLSLDLLRQAADLPGGERLRGRLGRADARELPFRDGVFDGVAILFSSFGYFGDEGDGLVLDGIARVLVTGGQAVLDLMNPARIREDLIEHSVTERGGERLEERRSLAERGRRVVKEVTLQLAGGARRQWTEDVRLYETADLRRLCEVRGLRVESVEGGFEGESFGPRADRQLLRLVKR